MLDVVFLFSSIPLFYRVLQMWHNIEEGHGPKYGADTKMMRHAVTIAIVIMLSCLGDNMFYHIHSMHEYRYAYVYITGYQYTMLYHTVHTRITVE